MATMTAEDAKKLEKEIELGKDWTMPEIHLGESVLWYQHPSSAPAMALVNKIYDRGLDLFIVKSDAGSISYHQRNFVRHRDDPNGGWQTKMQPCRDGTWAMTPFMHDMTTFMNKIGQYLERQQWLEEVVKEFRLYQEQADTDHREIAKLKSLMSAVTDISSS